MGVRALEPEELMKMSASPFISEWPWAGDFTGHASVSSSMKWSKTQPHSAPVMTGVEGTHK